ncbi:hypothetical protein FQZ97_716510 [compost metagenome]
MSTLLGVASSQSHSLLTKATFCAVGPLVPVMWNERFASVPVCIAQWYASHSVKASASANWNGISACLW